MTSGIIEILLEDTGVVNIPGIQQGSKVKVFPVLCEQGFSVPYIIVAMSQHDATTGSQKGAKTLLDYPQFDIICYSKSFRQAEEMREAVRAALDNKAYSTDAGYKFGRIWLSNGRDAFDNAAQVYAAIANYKAEVHNDN